jgi:hypothetical protein
MKQQDIKNSGAMISKKQQLARQLKSLAPFVSQQMRMQWAIENELNLSTVNRYLNTKEVGNVIVAQKLIGDMNEAVPK